MSAPAASESALDFGARERIIRTPWTSHRIPIRTLIVSAALISLAVLVAVFAIRYGDFPLTVREVLTALSGSGDEFHRMIVLEWRLPVAVAAVVFGALLGIGGAIFQSLTRNPLGSPDVIGFDAGSYTAVVVMILLVGNASAWALAGAALAGGLAAAILVAMLAYRNGFQGFRLIIVGIGVSAVLGSVNSFLITRSDSTDAIAVGFWGAGSITRVSWATLQPSLLIAALLLLATGLLGPSLRRLELGDDVAVAQGLRIGPARASLLILGVGTTALVTAASGPIGFIALVAPQLARRLTRSAGTSLLAAAALGSALLASAHLVSLLIAQAYRAIPVGLITVCLGGLYLIWLLIRESRRVGGATA